MAHSQKFVLIAALGTVVCCAASSSQDVLPSFSSFIQRYSRTYITNTEEYALRQKIYETRLQKVHHHNSLPNRLWDAAVNHLTDRSEEELSQLRGLRPIHSSNKAPGVVSIHKSSGQFLSQIRSVVVPEEKSWAHLDALNQDTDQGGCGSCWAVATSLMLQANAEIYGLNRTFSPQELVNCVPNPHSCGGTGGCAGATVELGMNWVMEKGLATESSTPYKGVDETCPKASTSLVSVANHDSAEHLAQMIAVGFHPAKPHMSPNPVADFQNLKGWERLPENQYQPLIDAVATRGPVAVSVGADAWSMYSKGVFNGCGTDATIDHAVTLIGYGTDKEKKAKFWLIRNSWGSGWGEAGNIRLFREEGDNAHCGTDSAPKQGTGCDNAPSSVHVCGMCGILYDSVVPHFEKATP